MIPANSNKHNPLDHLPGSLRESILSEVTEPLRVVAQHDLDDPHPPVAGEELPDPGKYPHESTPVLIALTVALLGLTRSLRHASSYPPPQRWRGLCFVDLIPLKSAPVAYVYHLKKEGERQHTCTCVCSAGVLLALGPSRLWQ